MRHPVIQGKPVEFRRKEKDFTADQTTSRKMYDIQPVKDMT